MHRVFKVVNQSELSLLREKAESAVERWIGLWCNREDIFKGIEVLPVGEVSSNEQDQPGWFVGQVDNQCRIGLRWSERLPEVICNAFLNIETTFVNDVGATTAISSKLVNRSITALLEMLIGEFNSEQHSFVAAQLSPEAFESELEQPGSGFVLMTMTFVDDVRMTLALDSKYLLSAVPAEPARQAGPLYPAINAFGNSVVKISASIGTAELDIEEISNLCVGDVISIDKKLSDKVALYVDGMKMCEGFLGQQDGLMSVKID